MMQNPIVICSLVILSVLSIWVNSFCIYIINVFKSYRSKPASIFILNLFGTHLFQAFVVLPTYTGKKMDVANKVWSYIFADGFLFTYLLSFYSVSLTTLCISVDRFLAAFLMTKYSKYVTPRNVLRTVTIMWVYVVLLCLIPFIQGSDSSHGDAVLSEPNKAIKNDSSHTSSPVNSYISSSLDLGALVSEHSARRFIENSTQPGDIRGLRGERKFYQPQKEWTVFMLFFNAALPLVVTALCYVYVIVRLRIAVDVAPMVTERTDDSREEASDQTTTMLQIKENKQYKHVTCVALALCSLYFMLWGPSIFYYTFHSVAGHFFICSWDNSSAEKSIVYFIKYASFLCSLVSPVIYCYRHPKVKKLVRKVTRNASTNRSKQTIEMRLSN